jgi:protein-tyrosine phosphatase
MRLILFVCTGNVFRSVAAEYALKTLAEPPFPYLVGSAGIEAKLQPVREWIVRGMREKGVDVSGHRPRRLTRELVDRADLVVAMSRDHRDFISSTFGVEAPLFKEVCYGLDQSIPDLHEVYPDWEQDLPLARKYVSSVIDMIWEDMRSFAEKLRSFQGNAPRV